MRRSSTPYLLAAFLVCSQPVMAAGPVSPAQCQVPSFIRLVGKTFPGYSLVENSLASQYVVVIRDAAANPIEDAIVRLRFNNCGQSFPSSDLAAGVSGEACNSAVQVTTDNLGTAVFSIAGSTLHRQGLDQTPGGCASITVEDPLNPGVEVNLSTSIRVSAFDLDGMDGVRASDLWLLLCDRNTVYPPSSSPQRSDYNGSGTCNAADISLWLSAYFRQQSELTGARCDNGGTAAPVIVPGTLQLRANKCGTAGGTGSIALTCASGAADVRLVGTAQVPAGVSLVAGFEAVVDVYGPGAPSAPFPGTPIPDHYRYESLGCNEGLLTSNDTSHILTGCGSPFTPGPTSGTHAYHYEWPYPEGPNAGRQDMARIRIVTAPTLGKSPGPMGAGSETMTFVLQMVQDSDMLPGCTGCLTPMAFVFNSLRITPPASGSASCSAPALATSATASLEPNLLVYSPSSNQNGVVFLNGVPSGFQFTGVGPTSSTSARLDPCSPNPAGGQTQIRFAIPRAGHASLVVFDLSGRRVRELVNSYLGAGEHSSAWDLRHDDGSRVASGTYFVRLRDEGGVRTRTVIALD